MTKFKIKATSYGFAECIGEPEVDYDGKILDENDNPIH